MRLKNILRRFAIYHYVVEIKLRIIYERVGTKFIPVDPKSDVLFKEQQRKDPNAVFHEAIEDLCRLAQSSGVKPVLLYLPTTEELNASDTSAILKVKLDVHKRLNVPLLDLTPDLKPEGKGLYLEADPVHLNAHGNEIVSRRLFEIVTALIEP